MRVVFSDALGEHGDRGVSHSVHGGPRFPPKTYALNGSSAIVRRGIECPICGRGFGSRNRSVHLYPNLNLILREEWHEKFLGHGKST
jgi:hypothetical protein